jgi:hypothetical protein
VELAWNWKGAGMELELVLKWKRGGIGVYKSFIPHKKGKYQI